LTEKGKEILKEAAKNNPTLGKHFIEDEKRFNMEDLFR
jgi:hypothetical protein